MHARVSRYDVPPENVDGAIEGFRKSGLALQELEGLIGGYVLVDEDSGHTVTVTLWESQASMANSGTRAASLRQAALREADGSVVSVEEYQVAVEFGGHTRDLREEE
jgi:heme-degrading monooxygenase HmoA